MNIPKYVADILGRSKFAYCYGAVPGYTIAINKRTAYTYATTLRDEARRLAKWANEQYRKVSNDTTAIAFVDSYEYRTHYTNQYAIVTIFDPVMKHIEHLIES